MRVIYLNNSIRKIQITGILPPPVVSIGGTRWVDCQD